MLDGITISDLLGSYLITGLVLYACFSTNVNVVLFLKEVFSLSEYFVFRPRSPSHEGGL